MTKKLFSFLQAMLLMALIGVACVGCKNDDPKTEPGNTQSSEINVTLPSSLDAVIGEPITLAQEGGAVTKEDFVYLEIDGKSTPCSIVAADETSFSFKVPGTLSNGTYKVYVKKGTLKKFIGSTVITFVTKQIPIVDGATVYGIIETADGTPIPNVVVSDGEICTQTNEKGIYYLKSEKNQKVVFYSVPSGYEPEVEGVFPQIYQKLTLAASVPENHSFKVKKVNGSQDNFKILYFGDMHLAQRTNDIGQFKTFTNDVATYKSAHSGEKIYAITLGDMTWDQYWKNGFTLNSYVKTLNDNMKDLTVYHTIGNHDHDPKSIASNFDATNPFMADVAPVWYSFNIGKVHFVVMDNIDCSPYDGIKDRPYTQGFYGVQHDWLEKDLSYVDKSTPVYIMSHGSIYSYNTSTADAYNLRAYGYEKTFQILAGREVHFVNAHLHQQHTMLPTDSPAKGYSHPVYEHNIPAVCADWWYSGYYAPGNHVCTDGTPAGYAIFDFTGKNVKWAYKGTQRSENDQFRVYDMNNVDFTYALSEFKNLKDANVISTFKSRYVTPYADGKFKNKVIINVWNWNSDCKIEVKTKDGKVLATSRYKAYDPLSILAMTIPYWDRDALTSVPGTGTSQRFHFFVAQCPDADTDIIVTTTDKFGNVCTQEIQRPYAFNLDQYKLK